MKKIIVLLITIMSLFGCNLSATPSSEVEKYLDNFNNLTESVLIDVDNKVSTENLSGENKEVYKRVLLRQYENMKYDIIDENIEGNSAIVKANITVYDYYKTEDITSTYMMEHTNDFNDSYGMFNNELYNSYRLGELLKTNDTTTYEVTFNLKKDDNGNWIMASPNRETLEKLNGFYMS